MWYRSGLRLAAKEEKEETAFVAFFLPPSARKALKHVEGLDDDLHMTLVYVTDGVKTEEDQEAILVAVKAIARAWGPISCELTEIGLMSNGSNAEVSNVTCHGGAAFYTDLVNAIEGEFGKFERKYDFLPHVTLRMKNGSRKTVGVDDFVPFSWKANAVTVQFGGEGGPKHEIKLTGKKKG